VSANVRMLLNVQRKGDIGSPRHNGSTRGFSSSTTLGSSALTTFFRPPPVRRILPGLTAARRTSSCCRNGKSSRPWSTSAAITYIVWCSKYRFLILEGTVAKYIEESIRVLCEWKDVEIEELSVMKDHVHLVVIVPPKVSISAASSSYMF
jgi:hypothetical protein